MGGDVKKATKKFCAEQIKRLSGKAFFPSTDEGKSELAQTLFDGAKSEEHAIRVITAAVRTQFGDPEKGESRCPSPDEIWELCRSVDADEKPMKRADPNCPHCAGTGWKEVQRGGNTGVERCCGAAPGNVASPAAVDPKALSDWYSLEDQRARKMRAGITEEDFKSVRAGKS